MKLGEIGGDVFPVEPASYLSFLFLLG